jgi:hypothetical protein
MPEISQAWRLAKTHHGDTLQSVAHREMEDASLWSSLVWLNGLRPPYLSSSGLHPGVADGTVILMGGAIKIPARAARSTATSATEAFGTDIYLKDGLLSVDSQGGLVACSGVPNLKQALELRLRNGFGCLPFHPRYGNSAHRLRGEKGNENAQLLALRYCEETALADPRVRGVSGGEVSLVGDAIRVNITALVDDGTTLKLQTEI